MAEGGLSRSVAGSSDVLYDFTCTPCSEDGKNNEAITYCINCQRYFCQTCVTHHNKVLKKHTILDKDGMKSAKLNPSIQKDEPVLLPSEYCEEHTGNILQMYCRQHDAVSCTVCIALDHRLCRGIDFIPKIAKGILEGQERNVITTSLSDTRRDLERIKLAKIQNLSDWHKDRDGKLEAIYNAKQRLVARIEELEQRSSQEVRANYKKVTDGIETEIISLDDALKQVESKSDEISNFKGNNEAQFFVHVKNGKKLELSSKTVVGKVSSNIQRQISFEFNSRIEELLFDVDSFGQVVKIGDNKCSFDMDYNVKTKKDKQACNIADISMLENGEYVVTDYDNQKLKRLDKAWNVIDTCDITRPFGVCNTGIMEVAVTSYQDMNVRIISVGATLSQIRSFDTRVPCKGISYSRNQLFVSCGILGQPGEIRIYDMKGVFMRGFSNLPTHNFTWINHLCFDSDGLNLYVADQDNGVVVLDRNGNKVSTINDPKLKYTHGVCMGVGGNLFVCGADSHNVLEVDRNGTVLQEMMVETGGKPQRPAAVRYFKKQRILVVACVTSDMIKVYKVT